MDLAVLLLVLWATTGLTFIHLVVIGARTLRRAFGPRRASPSPEADAPRPDLSLTFVVPVYNDGLTVGPCIESLLSQSVKPDRILVVNDGSTDDTRRVLDGYLDRGVTVLHLETNRGKSRAIEEALRHVDTDLVAVTDADSIVDHDYVKHIASSFADPEVVAAGGAVESIPHTWITAARQIEYMITVNVDRNAEHTMNSLVVLPGVSSTYRTAVLREMGFDHDTIAEDFDLTFRLQRAGRKLAMNLRAKVYTSDPPTLSSYRKQLLRWYTDFWLVLKKHRAVLGKRVFGTVEVPMLVLNAVASSVLYLVLPVVFLFTDPRHLVTYLAVGAALDLVLVVIAWRAYRRTDVWWSLLSRTPTRIIARTAFLTAMVRVLVGRPGTAWEKLERRGTAKFLATGTAQRTAGR